MIAAAESFIDSNVLLYLVSADTRKADVAERLLARGGVMSVQVLNEFASVASRKFGMPWPEIREVLDVARGLCSIVPVGLDTHDRALDLLQRHSLYVYDAMIVSAALGAGCKTLWSEDLQHGKRFATRLTVRNPFLASGPVGG